MDDRLQKIHGELAGIMYEGDSLHKDLCSIIEDLIYYIDNMEEDLCQYST